MTAGKRMISSTRGAMLALALLSSTTFAQTAPDLSQQKAKAQALEKNLPIPALTAKNSFELSPSRLERFQKFLPNTYRKLSQRDPFHLLVIGDASALEVHGDSAAAAFPTIFAQKLASQFFYTGGIRAEGRTAATETATISLRTLARPDGCVLDAAAILESTARQAPVDLVLICYGQNDAGIQPPTFSSAITAALAQVKLLGAEAILCSPWLPMADTSESVLGLSAPLADIQQETAAELGVLHADLGDLTHLLTLPTTETQDEGQIFERIERTYREYFYLDSRGSYLPRASLHQQLGTLLYSHLLESPAPPAWTVSEAQVRPSKSGELTLTYTLKNTGEDTLTFTALPLIASGWTPIKAKSSLTLSPKATQKLTVTYLPPDNAPPPLQESLLRLPILISGGPTAKVEILRASVAPIAIVWGLETQFNQETSFLVSCQLVNPGKPTLQGNWQAEFSGQKLDGNFDLNSDATTPLNLQFKLPQSTPASQSLPLTLRVKIGDQELTSTRHILLTRNLGLNQPTPLITQGTAPQNPITLTAKASRNALSLTLDLPGTDLIHDAPDGSSPAWQLEVNLDARSYGKRLEQGSTATLRVTGNSMDGPAKVHPIPAWAFGNGYAATFDPKEFKAALTTTSDKRQITFTLPRTYLNLHEWALDNGNSQLGLALRLTLQGEKGYTTHQISLSQKPAQDIDSLIVLELTEKPTPRLTVDVE
ncbi:MAG: SGNH/GDSL hydrolase family protein [Prosthecobacter sp.]|nr:SGNH/GDSL hydrolase family protein [Prosthecobacter sp.]